VENKVPVRSLQAVLRRLKFVAPDIRSVTFEGVDPVVAAEAAAREGLAVDATNPDGAVVWRPGAEVTLPPAPSGVVVVVVAAGVTAPPLPHCVIDRPAQAYVPLRDWVAGWFPAGSVLARVVAPILVSPAVGDRPTKVRLPGSREQIFTRTPLPAASGNGGSGLKMALVSGGGCGFFPLMPATLACAVMVPPALAVFLLAGSGVFLALTLAVFLGATAASVWLEKWAARELLAEDPREFVLDEFAGMAVTWAFLPPGAPWWAIGLGFLLFRFFDIFKWGVDWIEKLPIPGKIVWDDVLAGIYAGLVLLLVCRFLPGT
jgi:phosphatidylglycerophosphatase A